MLELDFTEFPTLITKRLKLREVNLDDASNLHVLRSDPEVMQFIGRPISNGLSEMQELIERITTEQSNSETITWGIELKESPGLVGTIGLYRLEKENFRGEVGYLLGTKHWGKGYMSEAIQALLQHAFQVFGFHSIEAITVPSNELSNKLLERNGFRFDGHIRECFYFDGQFYDSNIFSILASDPVTILST